VPQVAEVRDAGVSCLDGQNDLLRLSAARFVVKEQASVNSADGPQRPRGLVLRSHGPRDEPVVSRGPIVMNNQDALRTAFREYEQGTFIKH
jgi:redox-sensitive bicupin YhaK (pirin superfamily)